MLKMVQYMFSRHSVRVRTTIVTRIFRMFSLSQVKVKLVDIFCFKITNPPPPLFPRPTSWVYSETYCFIFDRRLKFFMFLSALLVASFDTPSEKRSFK